MKVVTVGEILWDVFDRAEFLGGAPLNFSAGAQRLGMDVSLISAVGVDERGSRALKAMATLGLQTDFVRVVSGRDTGTAIVETDARGNASYFIPRRVAFDDLVLDDAQMSQLKAMGPEWLYFGTLAQTNHTNEALVHRLGQELPGIKRFYDMNLRIGHWNLELVQRLSAGASVFKLNEDEAETLFKLTNPLKAYSLEEFCKYWSSTYDLEDVCITRGSFGCAIYRDRTLHLYEGFPVRVVDTVGAGDAFAAGFLHGKVSNWPIAQQASFANALGALVASRAGATPPWTEEECFQLIARHRAGTKEQSYETA